MRPPGDAKLPNPTLITNPTTAGVADLFNATYEVMLQMLVRFFAHTEETEEELQTLSSTAVDAMSSSSSQWDNFSLPCRWERSIRARVRDRISEFYRTSYLLPHRHAWVLMNERLLELADYCAGSWAPGRLPHQS